MDQRPPSKSASKAVEHEQSRQNAETYGVQGEEQDGHTGQLRGGSYLGDASPEETKYDERRPRHSKPNPRC